MNKEAAVYTEGESCRKCYSCVRSCPTKAIEVHSGQALIIDRLCISCGHCVNMCSQNAKRIRSSVPAVLDILDDPGGRSRFAIIAPSFPAAYVDADPECVVAALRAAGFDGVFETAFGADLVSYEYYRRFEGFSRADASDFMISSPCPAIVSYVEKLYPDLVQHLAPVVSPMEAMGRVLRETVDPDCKIVFIGPCVAKKEEARRSNIVDEVLTYSELNELLCIKQIDYRTEEPSRFDPPQANLGRLYPITGGLLKAASIDSDPLASPVYTVEGPERISSLLNVLADRVKIGTPFTNKLFDLLFCEGCIAGPFMPNSLSFFERRRYVISYLKDRPLVHDIEEWAELNQSYLDIDLSKDFFASTVIEPMPSEEEIRLILAKTNKFEPADELNCRACGYNSCRDKAVAVIRGTAEVEMCLPYLISQLETAITDLQSNQTKLIQAEKLASMGQMAAGIAHEINNPLGVVLMYAHLLNEQLDGNSTASADVGTIIKEAERTRKIVKGILNFAREEKMERIETDINKLIMTATEALEGIVTGGNVEIVLDLDEKLGVHMVDPNQLRQVLDNILKNAVEFMPDGGRITVRSREGEEAFLMRIEDSGPGIAKEHFSQIFSPFFTTKPVGKGTGLGLPVCYGIVKMHGGTLVAGNNPEGGAYFEVKINHFVREENFAQNIYS